MDTKALWLCEICHSCFWDVEIHFCPEPNLKRGRVTHFEAWSEQSHTWKWFTLLSYCSWSHGDAFDFEQLKIKTSLHPGAERISVETWEWGLQDLKNLLFFFSPCDFVCVLKLWKLNTAVFHTDSFKVTTYEILFNLWNLKLQTCGKNGGTCLDFPFEFLSQPCRSELSEPGVNLRKAMRQRWSSNSPSSLRWASCPCRLFPAAQKENSTAASRYPSIWNRLFIFLIVCERVRLLCEFLVFSCVWLCRPICPGMELSLSTFPSTLINSGGPTPAGGRCVLWCQHERLVASGHLLETAALHVQ